MTRGWQLVPADPARARELEQRLELPLRMAQLLASRSLETAEKAARFLAPRLEHIRDPNLMRGMEAASRLCAEALARQDRITIYGDYDVDGITATALLVGFLRGVGAAPEHYIPHRLTDGYGLNPQAAARVTAGAPGLLVTVDCGISSAGTVAEIKQRGWRVIVIDHHQVPEELPPADAILNPWQPGCGYPFKELASVGIAFLLLMALRRLLRERGFFAGRPEPRLREFLDLVALGSVADMAPLVEENRVLVHYGLMALNRPRRLGVKRLMEVAGVSPGQVTTHTIGYVLGPRLNAAGRIESAAEAINLLLSTEPEKALAAARRLEAANLERRLIEEGTTVAAEARVRERLGRGATHGLVLYDPDWHPGVIGIVAARLVERYHRPVILIGSHQGLTRGSGRSIPGLDLYAALKACSACLAAFGGHEQAAGLRIEPELVPDFTAAFEAACRERLTGELSEPSCRVDAELGLDEITDAFAEDLSLLAPFGIGNPEPLFVLRGIRPERSWTVGNGKHLKLQFRGPLGNLEAIGFGLGEQDAPGGPLDLLFHLTHNEFRGVRTLQLRLRDFRRAGEPSPAVAAAAIAVPSAR